MDSKHIKWSLGNTLLSGLVGYWKFNEVSGTPVDSHGSHNGTINGTVQQNQTGKLSQCIKIGNSTGNYITVANDDDFAFTDSFSVNFWCNTDSGGYQDFIGRMQGDPYNTGWCCLAINDAGTSKARFWIYTTGADYNFYANSQIYGAWRMLTFVHDSANNIARIYFNGTEDTPYTGTNTGDLPTITYGAGTYLTIGKTGVEAGTNCLEGSMDELGIWNRALTTDEITSLYNSGNGKTYPF